MKDTERKNDGTVLEVGAAAVELAQEQLVQLAEAPEPEVVLQLSEAGELQGVADRGADEDEGEGRVEDADTVAVGIIDLTPTVVTYIRITHNRTIISSRSMNRFLLCWKPQPKRLR